MKKRRYGKVLGTLAVLSFLVASVEGFLYYGDYAEFGLFRVLLTLQNSCKAFLFSPSLSAETVLKTLTGEVSTFELYIGLAYVAAAFVAPLCTATALFAAVERFFRVQLNAWRLRRREGVLIFGYNAQVKKLLKNQMKEKTGKNAPVIHLVADVELTEKEELELMKQNVFFHRIDCVYATEKSMQELFAAIQAKTIKRIFLLEDSSMRNVSLYLRLCELTGTKRAKEKLETVQTTRRTAQDQEHPEFPFAKGAVCCCRCSESYARELIGDYYDVEQPELGLYLFDLEELRVRKSLNARPIWNDTFCRKSEANPALSANRFDVHILIVGFGHTGEQMLRQTLNLSVAHSASRILIDVVDQDAAHKRDIFVGALQLDEAYITADGICIRSDGDKRAAADGELTIRFHHMDAQGSNFARLLRTTAAEMPFTYSAVCIKNLDVAIRCVSAIEHSMQANQPFPIAVNLEGSEQLAEYLDKNGSTYIDVFSMGGKTPDDLLCLEDIYIRKAEQIARDYHEIYRQIYFGPAGGALSVGKEWDNLKLYQQQANRLLHYHESTKEYVLCDSADITTEPSRSKKEIARDILHEHLKSAGICVEKDSFTYDVSEEEMLARLERDAVLSELMRMEHRRWCYAMLLDGWSGDCTVKNEVRKESPYICDWNHLEKAVRKYDLIPALMLGCKDN